MLNVSSLSDLHKVLQQGSERRGRAQDETSLPGLSDVAYAPSSCDSYQGVPGTVGAEGPGHLADSLQLSSPRLICLLACAGNCF